MGFSDPTSKWDIYELNPYAINCTFLLMIHSGAAQISDFMLYWVNYFVDLLVIIVVVCEQSEAAQSTGPRCIVIRGSGAESM